MNRVVVVKLLKTLTTLLAVLGPLVYALNQYGWNASALLAPQYTPPRIAFNIGFEEVKFADYNLTLVCRLQNLGDIEMELVDMEAFAYTRDGQPLVPVSLERAVVLNPNSTQTLGINLILDGPSLLKLGEHLRTYGEVSLRVCGKVYLRVLGSSITAPIEFTVQLKPEDLLNLLMRYGG